MCDLSDVTIGHCKVFTWKASKKKAALPEDLVQLCIAVSGGSCSQEAALHLCTAVYEGSCSQEFSLPFPHATLGNHAVDHIFIPCLGTSIWSLPCLVRG